MNSSVPYIIRAMNEWILDNDCTPYLVVDATEKGVSVPMDYVNEGQIVLNISPRAARDLVIGDEYIMFSSSFNGVPHEIAVNINAVEGIVARENGEGMWFPRDEPSDDPPPAKKGKPNLKVVK